MSRMLRECQSVVAGVIASLAVAAGCSSFDSASAAEPHGGSEASTLPSDGGGGDVVQPPVGCDPAADPKDAPKCVVSEFGVFVDATGGADANPGTKESPVKSIGAALGKLGNKQRVYVCEGTYAEHVKLTSAVSLYGGFACGAWSYSGGKAKIAPADVGYALQVDKVNDATLIEDLSVAEVTKSISGHATDRMKDHYSTVSPGEQSDGIGRVIKLVESAPSANDEATAANDRAAEPDGMHRGTQGEASGTPNGKTG
jgi:hypothetical protein